MMSVATMRSDWLSGASVSGVSAARSHVYAFNCGIYPLIKRSEAASSNKHVGVTTASSKNDTFNWSPLSVCPAFLHTYITCLSFTATSVLSGLTFDPFSNPTVTVHL